MKIAIIRHAKAEDRDEFALTGKPDGLRALTETGRKSTRKTARALKDMLPRIDVLASSPLLRALETAKLIAKEYKRLPVTELRELAPGSSEQATFSWLQSLPADAIVGIVGHDPDLSHLATWLLSGKTDPFVVLKKGGACLIDFPDQVTPGRGVLEWMLTPAQLRGLGE